MMSDMIVDKLQKIVKKALAQQRALLGEDGEEGKEEGDNEDEIEGAEPMRSMPVSSSSSSTSSFSPPSPPKPFTAMELAAAAGMAEGSSSSSSPTSGIDPLASLEAEVSALENQDGFTAGQAGGVTTRESSRSSNTQQLYLPAEMTEGGRMSTGWQGRAQESDPLVAALAEVERLEQNGGEGGAPSVGVPCTSSMRKMMRGLSHIQFPLTETSRKSNNAHPSHVRSGGWGASSSRNAQGGGTVPMMMGYPNGGMMNRTTPMGWQGRRRNNNANFGFHR